MKVMTEFDPSKPVMTRSGIKATVLTTTRRDRDMPIVALVHYEYGDDITSHRSDGASGYGGQNHTDLVNIPESKWMNLYEDPVAARIASNWHESRDEADRIAHGMDKDHPGGRRVAIVERKPSGDFITTAVEK